MDLSLKTPALEIESNKNQTTRKNVKIEKFRCFIITLSGKHVLSDQFPSTTKFIAGQLEKATNGNLITKLAVGYENQRQEFWVLNEWKKWLPNVSNISIERAKDARKAVKLCTLEENRHPDYEAVTITGGTLPKRKEKKDSRDAKFRKVIKLVDTGKHEKAEKFCKKRLPQFYVSNQKAFQSFVQNKSLEQSLVNPDYPIETFVPAKFNFPFGDKKNIWTVVLVGETNLCKTTFALANFKSPAHVKSKCGWSQFKPGHSDGIVIDDFSFNTWQSSNFLSLLDGRHLYLQDVKYGSIKITPGTPRIVCVNDLKLFWPKNICKAHVLATISRCIFYHVLKPLSIEQSQAEPVENLLKQLEPDAILKSVSKMF